jgi:hypothetical protein
MLCYLKALCKAEWLVALEGMRAISLQFRQDAIKHIAHLQQECHNSKFGIFELLLEKATFAGALLTGTVS